jgi:plasmid stabilization system protein ParE
MQVLYELTPKSLDDLYEIWLYIAEDDPKAADRVEVGYAGGLSASFEIPEAGQDTNRIDAKLLRFWTIPRYSNYSIVYQPETKPLRILGFIQGNRDIGPILSSRY